MDPVLQEIIQLEKEYRHDELFSGLSSVNEAASKIDLINRMVALLDDSSMEDAARESISNLIIARAMSPECAATILCISYPEDQKKYVILSQLFKERSFEDYAVFQAVYFARKYAEADYNYHLYDKYKVINEKYRMLYKDLEPDLLRGRGAVYTVITGGYDDLRTPEYIDNAWDYYCFTDDPDKYSSSIWKIRLLENDCSYDNTRLQRYAKMHPFELLPDYDYTVYVDGKFAITGNLREYVSVFSRGKPMLCFPHPDRQKLEDEVMAIKIRQGKNADVRDEMDLQVGFYRDEGYSDSVPLVESACLIRRNHDENVNRVMEDWWQEVQTRSNRDQLSLGYVCWKNNFSFDISALDIYDNNYLKFYVHNK